MHRLELGIVSELVLTTTSIGLKSPSLERVHVRIGLLQAQYVSKLCLLDPLVILILTPHRLIHRRSRHIRHSSRSRNIDVFDKILGESVRKVLQKHIRLWCLFLLLLFYRCVRLVIIREILVRSRQDLVGLLLLVIAIRRVGLIVIETLAIVIIVVIIAVVLVMVVVMMMMLETHISTATVTVTVATTFAVAVVVIAALTIVVLHHLLMLFVRRFVFVRHYYVRVVRCLCVHYVAVD